VDNCDASCGDYTSCRSVRSPDARARAPSAELSIGSIVASSMLFTHIRYFYRLDRDGPRNSSILLR
jgi:hypothetical protein